MGLARLTLHGDLVALLASSRRGKPVDQAFFGTAAVKDVVEAAGIPHPEVDYLLVDGNGVPLSQRISGEVRVSVFPHGLAPEPRPSVQVGFPFPDPRRFVLDVHLGGLASELRMLGFDTVWSNHADDPDLARVAAIEDRVLLTRDLGLLKRSEVRHGYFPRATATRGQLQEVLRRFDLLPRSLPFTRCLRCNGLLLPVEKFEVESQLPPCVREEHDQFRRCQGCQQVYWKGSHHTEMLARISRLG
ncbi:MAG: Mut7-C ubiquitin/RNAse domain-containing protein [Myxococcota bacterium]|nr:Mut7-C ubiquitin/RNAse domain-containing protein [Myxococcota bacterium]